MTVLNNYSNIKADLDGTNFAYDYRARLAYVVTFDHPHSQIFTYDIQNVSYECRWSNLHDRHDVSWSHDSCWKKKALASRHDGRKQNSYCLNRPLASPFVSALLIQLIFSTISRNSTDFLRRRNVYISLLNLMFISQNWVEIFEYIMNPESCDAKSGYFYPVT